MKPARPARQPRQFRQKSTRRAARALAAVSHVAERITRRRAPRVDVASLARDLHYSASHLRALFRTRSGESLGRRAKRLRLDRAAAALRRGRLSVADIAQRAGYASPEAFARMFKARFGVSPRRFARGERAVGPLAWPVEMGLSLAAHFASRPDHSSVADPERSAHV
ncbi:MAG: helix-turn-helix domain-containing protein [Burkholderiales bacterium]|nr:helix-turn-helix domain-containing protein [Burkholderiales bacterium]